MFSNTGVSSKSANPGECSIRAFSNTGECSIRAFSNTGVSSKSANPGECSIRAFSNTGVSSKNANPGVYSSGRMFHRGVLKHGRKFHSNRTGVSSTRAKFPQPVKTSFSIKKNTEKGRKGFSGRTLNTMFLKALNKWK